MRSAFACAVLAIGCGQPATGSDTSALAPVPMDAIVDNTIALTPESITIVGMPNVETTAMGAIGGTVPELTGVMLMDPNIPAVFRFVQPTCAGSACTFSPGIPLANAKLEIACTPTATPRFASVTVIGTGGVMDTSGLECVQTASAPGLAVPDPQPVSSLVGVPATTDLSVTNTGNVALDISLQLDPTSDWTAMTCVAPATCPVAVNQTIQIPLTFTPTIHGDRSSTLQVLSAPDAGTKFVTLAGTGLGGVLRVDQPSAATNFGHSFGTIAKGQLATFTVQMTNTGNQQITVTPSAASAPFGVPTAPVTLAGNNGTGSFDVTCMSATAGGPFTAMVELAQSPNTYDRNASQVTFDCAIANTTIQVEPNPVAMGELRVGDATMPRTVTVTNPAGGGAVTIERIQLRGNPAALTLAAPSLPLPATLQDGKDLTVDVELATTEDVTLDNVVLEVEVTEGQTAVLSIPVTGRVGTPRAIVVPDQLALGTVCVGTPVMGTVTMTNTGTITLHVQRPAMSTTEFAPLFTNPTSYPEPPDGVPLLETDSAMVGVMPASQNPGRIEGTLEWSVDVPLAPFRIPVSLELIASGTAVSPAAMKFGAVELGKTSTSQLVTLENCGTEPVLVTYGGVHALEGRAGAWVLTPPGDQRTLNPHDTMRIMVAFSPADPGAHRAEIQLAVDGAETVVALDGEGVGTVREKTSFYACTCSGGGAPGWPIVVALAVVVRRRRRPA